MQTSIHRMDKQQGPTVYSTGNYIQYLMIKHEKEYKKECMYMYHFAAQQINATL